MMELMRGSKGGGWSRSEVVSQEEGVMVEGWMVSETVK